MAEVSSAVVAPKEKPFRTKTGCLTCRRRKKKCDESRCPETGGCVRCKNSGYECLGYPRRKVVAVSMEERQRHQQEDSRQSIETTFLTDADSSIPSPLAAARILETPLLDHAAVATPSHSALSTTRSGPSCSIIGTCILLGQPICQSCLTSIQPVLSPSDPTPEFQISTPLPLSATLDDRHGPVLHCLIGYYAVVLTCWVEGCHPHNIVNSVFFRELVQYLFHRIDHDEGLRLSITSCASGYIGGGQLSWPEDLKAISEWTDTLRRGATELVNVATTSSAPAARPLDDASDRLARHSYLDRHLSRNARYLYRMARRHLENTLQMLQQGPDSRLLNVSQASTDYIDRGRMRHYNNLLLAAVSQAIFSWAELSIETYYQDFDQALQLVNTLCGGVRRIKLKVLNTVDTLGFATVVYADVCAALARGCRPYFYLEDEGEPSLDDESHTYPFHFFNYPSALLKCLSDLARLRFDCDAAPTMAGQSSRALPDRLARQASQLESSLNALASVTHPSAQYNGSPNCAEMTRLAALILLYSAVYRKGPLNPTIKYSLQCILNLWQYGAKAFCVDVGCTNYLFSIVMASSVAHEARDRVICEEAMNLVGHDEATADAGRRLIKEVWRRTDESGMPVFWFDLVKEGSHSIAFL